MDYKKDLRNYLNVEIEVLQELDLDAINRVMNVLENARITGKKIFICGNGGSAAIASHFCCDFNKGVSEKQENKYNFECLSDNIATMTAVANDINYEEVFRFPLRNKMKKGDVVIGISGSGNSENVLNALYYAKEKGAVPVAIVGYDGGKMKQSADYCIHVKIDNMQIAEDAFQIIDHVMMYILAQKENKR